MTRCIAAIETDLHGGSVMSLLTPGTVLPQEDAEGNIVPWTPQLTPVQESIWAWRCLDVQTVIDLADGDPIHVWNLADITHGNRFMRELVSTRDADQFLIAAENDRSWLRLPNVASLSFNKGTSVHEFGQGTAPLLVAEILRKEFPSKRIEVGYHFDARINGVQLDLSHHGAPPGIRKWLEGNVLELYARDIIIKALLAHQDPPDFIGRGHFHTFATRVSTVLANGRTYEARATICPSYSATDDHARKAGRSPAEFCIGLVALEIVDGKIVKQHEFRRTIDQRTRQIL